MVVVEEDQKQMEGQNCEDDDTGGVSGWADSIAKILKSSKPKGKKELILSRAKKDYEVSKSDDYSKKKGKGEIEVVPVPEEDKPKPKEDKNKDKEGGDEGVKEEKKDKDVLSLREQRKLELKQKKLDLAWENLARLNAEKTDPQIEKDLMKVATKGVVQLFNAISMQQKTIKSKLRKANSSEFKKDKVLHQTKEMFEDALTKSKGMASKDVQDADNMEIKEEEVSSDEEQQSSSVKFKRRALDSDNGPSASKKKPLWSALQDDFMLDAKLKDWDKESDSD